MELKALNVILYDVQHWFVSVFQTQSDAVIGCLAVITACDYGSITHLKSHDGLATTNCPI